jgi:citrate synthase
MNRLSNLGNHFGPALAAQKETLSVTDNRTGKSYELAITDGAINATDLAKIKSEDGHVTRSFDPAYMNTVTCISRISFIEGDKGILEYRGYPIE